MSTHLSQAKLSKSSLNNPCIYYTLLRHPGWGYDFSFGSAASGRESQVTPYGFALGEKNPIGKSFAVRNPAGASRITGIEFTATEAVAMSP